MIKFNEVTWYSKLAAAIFFIIIVPILAFCIGTQYQEVKDSKSAVISEKNIAPISHDATSQEQVNKPKIDSADVMSVARGVLTALKNKDFISLQQLSSSRGLTWNEEPNLDFSKIDISHADIARIPSDTTKYLFGYTDGKGDPIVLTRLEYINQWIYNHDYLNADEVGVNRIIDGGMNSRNTINEDAELNKYVAFHFKGFDPKYEGMDWTTLYLVFDWHNGEYKLYGIAKSNWTI